MRLTVFFLASFIIISCQKKTVTNIPEGETQYVSVKKDSPAIMLVLKDWTNSDIPLRQIVDSLGLTPRQLSVRITKSAYELGIYNGDILLKNYPVVFGSNPLDDKLREGDQCTPEGTFKMRSKYDHKKWTRFIWIDYPNAESWKKHNAAKKKGLITKHAGIGGEIGIHGVPAGYDEAVDYRQNWTLGCISMKNKDVIDLYPFITTSTVIEIRK